jgi:hypothetical protein
VITLCAGFLRPDPGHRSEQPRGVCNGSEEKGSARCAPRQGKEIRESQAGRRAPVHSEKATCPQVSAQGSQEGGTAQGAGKEGRTEGEACGTTSGARTRQHPGGASRPDRDGHSDWPA